MKLERKKRAVKIIGECLKQSGGAEAYGDGQGSIFLETRISEIDRWSTDFVKAVVKANYEARKKPNYGEGLVA